MSRNTPEARVASKGPLGACLVEGDAEQLTRARRSRSKALAFSLAMQAGVLAALILVPLLATGERLSFLSATPIPPYYGSPQAKPHHVRPSGNPHRATEKPPDNLTQPSYIPVAIATENKSIGDPAGNGPPNIGGGVPQGIPDGIVDGNSSRPLPPLPPVTPVVNRKGPVLISHIDPAMLIHRVEPVYPVLAKLTHREGRVELRAIISTDGSIKSLEVLSGDVMFVREARDAVQQWRYRPLFLSGQPVEIETRITVIFTLHN